MAAKSYPFVTPESCAKALNELGFVAFSHKQDIVGTRFDRRRCAGLEISAAAFTTFQTKMRRWMTVSRVERLRRLAAVENGVVRLLQLEADLKRQGCKVTIVFRAMVVFKLGNGTVVVEVGFEARKPVFVLSLERDLSILSI